MHLWSFTQRGRAAETRIQSILLAVIFSLFISHPIIFSIVALLWELAASKKGENNSLPTTYRPTRIKPKQGANIFLDKEPNRQQKKCLCLQGTGGIMVCWASKKGRELKEWLNPSFFQIRKTLSHLHRKQTALKACSMVSLSVLQRAGYLKTCRKKRPTLPCVHVHV